ncbi:MAG: hypothetical protein NUV78_02195 [Candidatus Zambryskibacteria bacterium]|nr:hypothetical protein [Candidatus Zambryskibacteria bacterium]
MHFDHFGQGLGDVMETFTEGSATAQMVCDSIFEGSRIVSIETTFPRPFLAEFNTHCRFSRNSASSRAIPVWKRMIAVLEKPYIPNSFGVNKAGMQAGEELSAEDQRRVVQNWLFGRDMAILQAYALAGGRKELLSTVKGEKSIAAAEALFDKIEQLSLDHGVQVRLQTQDRGLHKQHANRVLETYAFHTVIVTATHWRNFLGLRVSKMAQPEACDFGTAIAKAMRASAPIELHKSEWHLPYIRPEDRAESQGWMDLAYASSGKCARTSYLTHAGIRSLEEDISMAKGLLSNGHMSPFQHPARPRQSGDLDGSNGNYSGKWTQLRKLIENEGDFSLLISKQELVEGCRGDEELADYILSLSE